MDDDTRDTWEWKLLARDLEETRSELHKARAQLGVQNSGSGHKDMVAALVAAGATYNEQWTVFELNGVQFRAAPSYPMLDLKMLLSRREIEYVLIGTGWNKCMVRGERMGMFEDPKNPGQFHKLRDAYAVEMSRTDEKELVALAKRLGSVEKTMELMRKHGVTVDQEQYEQLSRNLPSDGD